MFKSMLLAVCLLGTSLHARSLNVYGAYGLQLLNPSQNALPVVAASSSIDKVENPINEFLQTPSFDLGAEMQFGRFSFGAGFKSVSVWDFSSQVVFVGDIGETKQKGSLSSMGGYISTSFEFIKTKKTSSVVEYRFGRMFSSGQVNFVHENTDETQSDSVNNLASTDYFHEMQVKEWFYLNDSRDLAVGIEASYMLMDLNPVYEMVSSHSAAPVGFSTFGPPKKPQTFNPYSFNENSFSIKISVKRHFSF